MKSKFLMFLSVSALSCMLASGAYAESNVSADPAVVLELAKGYGSASLDKDSDGDPQVKGRIEGVSYLIAFYGCQSGRDCKSLQFAAFWSKRSSTTLEAANQYNREFRAGRAYIDKDGDLVLAMPVELQYGMSRKNLDENFTNWNLALKKIKGIADL
jgi:hypothetical protein